MRIGVDGRALTGRYTGDRTYWRNLLRALPSQDPTVEYIIYSRTGIAAGELPDAPNLVCREIPAANDRVWTLAALPRALRRDRADLAHVQYTAPPPGVTPCPVVTTVHDISFRLYPQWFPFRHRLLLNLTVPPSMHRAARVITDSQSSRRDILRVYKLPGEKVVAIPLAPGPEFTTTPSPLLPFSPSAPLGLDGPFILAVGVLQPRKNLRLLAEAFGLARARHGLAPRLICVGKTGWSVEQDLLRQAAKKHGGDEAARAVVFPGYVPDADLPMLYRACAAFAYPSLYEGFGLPPLEAMACGTPTLVSDAPALPEVVGDAALIVPATEAAAWAEALACVLTDPDRARDLRRRGPIRAAQFSWQQTARMTLEVYRQALNQT